MKVCVLVMLVAAFVANVDAQNCYFLCLSGSFNSSAAVTIGNCSSNGMVSVGSSLCSSCVSGTVSGTLTNAAGTASYSGTANFCSSSCPSGTTTISSTNSVVNVAGITLSVNATSYYSAALGATYTASSLTLSSNSTCTSSAVLAAQTATFTTLLFALFVAMTTQM